MRPIEHQFYSSRQWYYLSMLGCTPFWGHKANNGTKEFPSDTNKKTMPSMRRWNHVEKNVTLCFMDSADDIILGGGRGWARTYRRRVSNANSAQDEELEKHRMNYSKGETKQQYIWALGNGQLVGLSSCEINRIYQLCSRTKILKCTQEALLCHMSTMPLASWKSLNIYIRLLTSLYNNHQESEYLV